MDKEKKGNNESKPDTLRVESLESNIPAPGKETSEDAVLNMSASGLFGVFDGVGGADRPADSSRLASQTVAEKLADTLPLSETEEAERLKSALVSAHESILKEQEENPHLGSMGTTGTVCRTVITATGKKMLVYAHVGDCRIIVSRNQGEIEHVTNDEADGNMLHNLLGSGFQGVRQTGFVELYEKDRILICSDGITGDWEGQFLSNEEYASALDRSYNLQKVMENLINTSRKVDDKGVVVLDVASAA